LCWEGIHEGSWDSRVVYARECYNFIVAHANDTTINSWYNPNAYLSVEQRLNNAVMLYRHLSAGGGGGGTPTKRKNHMPAWMKINYNLRRY
jgi:hypothetical protein